MAAPLTPELRRSYDACMRATRQAASNFYWSFWMLPVSQRRAMCALYAFSRRTDDLGDSDLSAERRGAQLRRWRAELLDALEGTADGAATARDVSIWPALIDTVRTFAIPRQCLLDIVDGVMMDLQPPRYEKFADLQVYCRRVASAVGVACIHIWGFSDPRALEPADACGIAFQLTNILRDLREDAERGRVYLPVEDLERFGMSTEELLRGVFDERCRALIRFELERAERLYDQAAQLASYLPGPGRRSFGLMFAAYRELLAEIKRRDGDVFTRRTRLRPQQKLRLAGAAMAGWWYHSAFG